MKLIRTGLERLTPSALQDRFALVTGANRGLGKAISKSLGSRGASVACLGKDQVCVEDSVGSMASCIEGGCFHGVVADLTHAAEVGRAIEQLTQMHGPIEILVNNAGVLSARRPMHEVRLWELESSLEVNLWAPFRLIRRVVPTMVERRRGVIINVSDGVGTRGEPNWGAYGVSKGALEAMTITLAADLRGTGVRVYSVDPGSMNTRLRGEADPDGDREQHPNPDIVAGLFAFLASDEGSSVPSGPISWRSWSGWNEPVNTAEVTTLPQA